MLLVPISAILFALTGCAPSPSDNVNSSAAEIATGRSSTTNIVHDEPKGEVVVIDGQLESVDWRSLVGRTVTITGELTIVDTFDLIRRGQVKVARNRLYIPTNRIDPNDADAAENSFEGGSNVAKITEAQKFNDQATVILDDGSADQNVFPPALFPNLGRSQPTVRIGSVIRGITGKMVQSEDRIFLVPNQPVQWTPSQRPRRPDLGDSDITVASFNVLNYFTTIDNGSNNARGADSDTELDRQQAKIVSAIIGLQADVIGVMEIENNLKAENRLVAALNKKMGKTVFKGCGLPTGFRKAPGGRDSIRVGIIYRLDRVKPVADVSMINDRAFFLARTPVVQRFQPIGGEKPFSVIVNHFKSKGGADRADPANQDKGDGQSAYNAARRSQALAICDYIESLKQDIGDDPRVLVIGDLNAYGQEDPIDAMRARGLVDLQARFDEKSLPETVMENYSFVYYGQCGSLDHAMATAELAGDVSGIATWHINADEPRFLDYNQEFNPRSLFNADPFRSSDHDPVLIGIQN